MADYISREDAVSQIFDKVWTKTDEDGYIWVLRRDVVYTLDDIPTADVVEVVRCKDCELWNYYKKVRAGRYFHEETEALLLQLLSVIKLDGLEAFHELCQDLLYMDGG